MIPVDEYVAFLDREYVDGYLEGGGAAIKFVVPPDDGSAPVFMESFAAAAQSARFDVARVDAVETRVHLLEEVFFAVARQVDWDELAAVATRSALAAVGYPAPDGRVTLDALASHYGVDSRELKRDVDRQLQEQVHRDYAMVQEFRIGHAAPLPGSAPQRPSGRRRAHRRVGLAAGRPPPDSRLSSRPEFSGRSAATMLVICFSLSPTGWLSTITPVWRWCWISAGWVSPAALVRMSATATITPGVHCWTPMRCSASSSTTLTR